MQMKRLSAAFAVLLAAVAGVVYAAGGFDRLKDTVKLGQGTASDKVLEFDVGASPNPKLTGLGAGTGITSTVNFSLLDRGQLKLDESTTNGANYVALRAPATLAADTTYTLPADGANGALMQTDGAGTLSWFAGGALNTLLHGAGVTSSPTWSAVVNADVDAAAAIARTKIAAGTADHVVINDGSGALSSEAALSPARGGTGVVNDAAATLTRSGAYDLALTTTAATSLTLPTAGTVLSVTATGSGGSASLGAFGTCASASAPVGSVSYVKYSDNTMHMTGHYGVTTNSSNASCTTSIDITLPVSFSAAPVATCSAGGRNASAAGIAYGMACKIASNFNTYPAAGRIVILADAPVANASGNFQFIDIWLDAWGSY